MSLGDELRKRLGPLGGKWKRRPEVLLCPNVPKPLHGLAPRVVLGKDWWDVTRVAAYRSTLYHCIACGVHKSQAKEHKWLEGHETYHIDYLIGRMYYVETVPLCHYCHNYIHSGRMQSLVGAGLMDAGKYQHVINHGNKVIREAGLKHRAEYSGPEPADWADWRLVIDGQEYGPAFKSFAEWCKSYNPKEDE